MKETSPENESFPPRTREASIPSVGGPDPRPDGTDQLKEDGVAGMVESDPFILVRGGRTDHTPAHGFGDAGTAKGWAGWQRGQCTHARGRNVPTQSVSSTLTALNRKAVGDRGHRFRDLYRLLNLQALYESFGSLKKNAAPGVDGVTWRAYEANLDENLRDLLERLKAKRYRAPHVKRCYLPKGDGKLRPLGLPTLEDKIVQHAASRILESIYDADFSDRSLGYWNYYCVIANDKLTWRYNRAVMGLVFKWLNRRSQRKSFTWAQFLKNWKGSWQIPTPRVVEKWKGQQPSQIEIPLV